MSKKYDVIRDVIDAQNDSNINKFIQKFQKKYNSKLVKLLCELKTTIAKTNVAFIVYFNVVIQVFLTIVFLFAIDVTTSTNIAMTNQHLNLNNENDKIKNCDLFRKLIHWSSTKRKKSKAKSKTTKLSIENTKHTMSTILQSTMLTIWNLSILKTKKTLKKLLFYSRNLSIKFSNQIKSRTSTFSHT